MEFGKLREMSNVIGKHRVISEKHRLAFVSDRYYGFSLRKASGFFCGRHPALSDHIRCFLIFTDIT